MQNFVLFSYNAINSVRCIMAKKITVVPYDPKWADEFKKIKNELLPVIGDNAIAIEHVGSTSVEGLWAKPVIDIDVVIDNENLPVIIKKLADIGYYHKGDMGISGREAFGYNDDEKCASTRQSLCGIALKLFCKKYSSNHRFINKHKIVIHHIRKSISI